MCSAVRRARAHRAPLLRLEAELVARGGRRREGERQLPPWPDDGLVLLASDVVALNDVYRKRLFSDRRVVATRWLNAEWLAVEWGRGPGPWPNVREHGCDVVDLPMSDVAACPIHQNHGLQESRSVERGSRSGAVGECGRGGNEQVELRTVSRTGEQVARSNRGLRRVQLSHGDLEEIH